jgi:hypothetical protein
MRVVINLLLACIIIILGATNSMGKKIMALKQYSYCCTINGYEHKYTFRKSGTQFIGGNVSYLGADGEAVEMGFNCVQKGNKITISFANEAPSFSTKYTYSKIPIIISKNKMGAEQLSISHKGIKNKKLVQKFIYKSCEN